MSFLVVNGAAERYADQLVTDLMASLFTNDHTPTVNDTVATFDIPEAFWYSNKDVFWPKPAQLVSGQAEVVSAPVVWTVATPATAETVYGYFLKDLNTGRLVGAQRFDAPIVMQNTGDRIAFAVKAVLKDAG